MQLPRPVQGGGAASGGGARYNLVTKARTEPSGALVARFTPRPSGVGYLVRRVVLQGPSGSICRIYTGEPDETSLADGSQAGALDIADYYQPLYVDPATELVAVWTEPDGRTNVTGSALVRIEIEELG